MNGAKALIKTLKDSDIEVCFANPGTSEMQLVAAIDSQKDMRAILGLFEGVVTGAADGYARMAEKSAVTLLHLGPGLGNGLANLHNAKRAFTPVVNIVGDHAVDHVALDAPLTSDVVGVAKPMSDWVRITSSASDLALAGAEAYAEVMTYPGKVATVIAPANHAWTEGASPAAKKNLPEPPKVSEAEFLQESIHIVFVGTPPPVSFFEYPGKPSWLSPEEAQLLELANPRQDALDSLTRLTNALAAPEEPAYIQEMAVPPIQEDVLTPASAGSVIANMISENAIVSDEATTAGLAFFPMTQGAPKHD